MPKIKLFVFTAILIALPVLFNPFTAKAQFDYGYYEPVIYIDPVPTYYPTYDYGVYYNQPASVPAQIYWPVDNGYRYIPDNPPPAYNYTFHSPVDPNYKYVPDPAPTPTTQAILPPAVSISANPSTINYPGSSVLTWTSQNASSCWGSGAWAGTMAPSGTVSVNPVQTITYTVYCINVQGQQSSASAVVTVNGNQAQPQQPQLVITSPPPPIYNYQNPPTVYITASPQILTSGGSTLISWNSSNAYSCYGNSGLSGNLPISGSQQLNVYQTTSYGITCNGSGGTNSAQTIVTVGTNNVYYTNSYPNVSLSITPSTVTAGNNVLLVWNSTNTSICSALGGWSGTKAVSGSEIVTPAANTTYTISCSSAGGNISDSKTVTVNPAPAPVVTVAAAPTQTPVRHIAARATAPSFTRTVVNLNPVKKVLAADRCDLNNCLNDKIEDDINLAFGIKKPGIGERLLATIFIGNNGNLSFLAYIFAVLFIIMFAIIVFLLRKLNKQKQAQVAL